MPCIYQTLTADDAIDAFRRYDRLQTDTTSGNFTPAAVRALFNLYEDIGEPVELDVIAWCCDWAEYDSAMQAASEYGYIASEYGDEPDDDDDAEGLARAWLEDQTTVLDTDDGSVVVASF